MRSPLADFHVLTGGPGSGKTSLLDQLQGAGIEVTPEAGRAIIKDQMQIDGPALPWADRALFAELMLAHDMRCHRDAGREGAGGPVMFDRGVPDIVGYLRLEGLPVPAHVMRAVERLRYNRRVFIAPPWPEIYCQDGERRQDEETARRTFEAMRQVYGELDYELVELPKTTVTERAVFVRARLG